MLSQFCQKAVDAQHPGKTCRFHIDFKSMTAQQKEKVFDAERLLTEAGITFDTGYDLQKARRRDWELDWSLKGAAVSVSAPILATVLTGVGLGTGFHIADALLKRRRGQAEQGPHKPPTDPFTGDLPPDDDEDDDDIELGQQVVTVRELKSGAAAPGWTRYSYVRAHHRQAKVSNLLDILLNGVAQATGATVAATMVSRALGGAPMKRLRGWMRFLVVFSALALVMAIFAPAVASAAAPGELVGLTAIEETVYSGPTVASSSAAPVAVGESSILGLSMTMQAETVFYTALGLGLAALVGLGLIVLDWRRLKTGGGASGGGALGLFRLHNTTDGTDDSAYPHNSQHRLKGWAVTGSAALDHGSAVLA